jgi:hypothetical protein
VFRRGQEPYSCPRCGSHCWRLFGESFVKCGVCNPLRVR